MKLLVTVTISRCPKYGDCQCSSTEFSKGLITLQFAMVQCTRLSESESQLNFSPNYCVCIVSLSLSLPWLTSQHRLLVVRLVRPRQMLFIRWKVLPSFFILHICPQLVLFKVCCLFMRATETFFFPIEGTLVLLWIWQREVNHPLRYSI